MPRGFKKSLYPDLYGTGEKKTMAKVTTINVESVPELPRHGNSALGTLDRLRQRAELEYKSLLVVTAMVERDATERAQASMPAKLAAATQTRRKLLGGAEEMPEMVIPKTKRIVRDGQKMAAERERGKTQFTKGRLMLFCLEHIPDDRYMSREELHTLMLKKGNPPMKGGAHALNPVVGQLKSHGWIKRGSNGEYRLLAPGRAHAARLRAELEANGEIDKHGYFLPKDWVFVPKPRGGDRRHVTH